jgi:CBS domain containing-hemolysin-like protein
LLGIVAEPAVTELIALLVNIEAIGAVSAHSISIVISVIIINFVHTVWGEQAPTYFGVERAKMVSRYCATPLYWWTKVIYPVLYIGDWLTKGTLAIFGIKMERSWTKTSAGEGSHSDLKGKIVELLEKGDLSKDRRQEVVNALEIDELPVREIMVSRENIIFLSTKEPLSENMERIKSGKSRYPLCGSSMDNLHGVIYTSEMLAHIQELSSGKRSLEELSRPGMTVSTELPVSTLIDQFQSQNQELALITEDNHILGLATITDAMEAIVGSAKDPMDVENG